MTREDVTRRTPAIKGAKAPRSERKETPQGWSHWNWSREWRCPGAGLPTQSTGRAAAMVLLDGEARHTVVELRPVDADEGGRHCRLLVEYPCEPAELRPHRRLRCEVLARSVAPARSRSRTPARARLAR